MGVFLLGVHRPGWLSRPSIPMMLSRATLSKRPPVSVNRSWALDSGAFSCLMRDGDWLETPQSYVTVVRRWSEGTGTLLWAATQDWLCAPPILAMTGLTIKEHQQRTVASWHTLREIAPDLPWVPTLQGWSVDDYLQHAAMYEANGATLAALPLVGVGSIAPRQHTPEAYAIVSAVESLGITLHGWGVKRRGLRRYGHLLASADSAGWSLEARFDTKIMCQSGRSHARCNNCPEWAERWGHQMQGLMDKHPNNATLVSAA